MQPQFFYDFNSPESYVVAERIIALLDTVPEFIPVAERALNPELQPNYSIDALIEEIDRSGLQPLTSTRYGDNTQQALLAATYTAQIGKVVAFSYALLRQVYAGGRRVDDEATLVLAGAACEIHPRALSKGASLGSIADKLGLNNKRARNVGVARLPAVIVGESKYYGFANLLQGASLQRRPRNEYAKNSNRLATGETDSPDSFKS